jgi:hypothetical protein
MNGPYIVTTKRGDPPFPNNPAILSRRAIATLDEARIFCTTYISDRWSFRSERFAKADGDRYQPSAAEPYDFAISLPESGGTIGPLPDGMVIEVEATTWLDLAREAGLPDMRLFARRAELDVPGWQRLVLDAYNARQQA